MTPRKVTLADGRVLEVGCQQCKPCQSNKKRDWIGRALAESKNCVGSNFITMTYGKTMQYGEKIDDPGAYSLTYRDFQLWAKRVRKAGYKFRYIVAGERGTLKGRCHFHVVVFWTNKIPNYSRAACWRDDPFWHHGHTHWDDVRADTIGYCVKYAYKDQDDAESESLFKASTRPLLGGKYFDDWARRHVEAGLPLKQGRKYTVDGVLNRGTNRLWEYWMSEAAMKYVCRSYIKQWEAKYGTLEPDCPLIERYKDRKERLEKEATESAILKAAAIAFDAGDADMMEKERQRIRQTMREKLRAPASMPTEPAPEGARAYWSETLNSYVADAPSGRFYWNGRARGLHEWSRTIGEKRDGPPPDVAADALHQAELRNAMEGVAEVFRRSRGDPPF